MSYCRFNDNSDVYMYHHCAGVIECCSCILTEKETHYHSILKQDFSYHTNETFKTREEALIHLLQHKLAGHDVEADALHCLLYEVLYNNKPLEVEDVG